MYLPGVSGVLHVAGQSISMTGVWAMTTTILCGLQTADCGLRTVWTELGLGPLPAAYRAVPSAWLHKTLKQNLSALSGECRGPRPQAPRWLWVPGVKWAINSVQILWQPARGCHKVAPAIGRSVAPIRPKSICIWTTRAEPTDPNERTNERTSDLPIEPLCKSNAGRANLLSQLAGLLRISCRIGVLGRTHPEAVVAVAFHVSISASLPSSSLLSSSFFYSSSSYCSFSSHSHLCCDQCLGLAERARGKWRGTERASKSRRGRERELHARSFGCAPRLPQASSSCRPILSSFACGCRPVAAISCSCAVPKSTSNRAPKKKTKEKNIVSCRRRRRRRPLLLSLSRSLARSLA